MCGHGYPGRKHQQFCRSYVPLQPGMRSFSTIVMASGKNLEAYRNSKPEMEKMFGKEYILLFIRTIKKNSHIFHL